MEGLTLKDFELIGKIGEGSIGAIFKAKYIQNKSIYALKIIKNIKNIKDRIEGLELSKKFNHPNVIRSYGYFIDEYKGKLCIISVLEYIEGTDLYDISITAHRNVRNKLSHIILQLVYGLNYIHSFNVVHRDIKLENIMLTKNDNIKIIDFDFIIKEKDNTGVNICGTPYYIAPEILKNNMGGKPCDIWALGVVIYVLLTNFYPFEEEGLEDLYNSILNDAIDLKYIPNIYKNLISGTLEKDPRKRYTLKEMIINLKE